MQALNTKQLLVDIVNAFFIAFGHSKEYCRRLLVVRYEVRRLESRFSMDGRAVGGGWQLVWERGEGVNESRKLVTVNEPYCKDQNGTAQTLLHLHEGESRGLDSLRRAYLPRNAYYGSAIEAEVLNLLHRNQENPLSSSFICLVLLGYPYKAPTSFRALSFEVPLPRS